MNYVKCRLFHAIFDIFDEFTRTVGRVAYKTLKKFAYKKLIYELYHVICNQYYITFSSVNNLPIHPPQWTLRTVSWGEKRQIVLEPEALYGDVLSTTLLQSNHRYILSIQFLFSNYLVILEKMTI